MGVYGCLWMRMGALVCNNDKTKQLGKSYIVTGGVGMYDLGNQMDGKFTNTSCSMFRLILTKKNPAKRKTITQNMNQT